MTKVHNYSAGHVFCPKKFFRKAAAAVQNFNGLNLSILEVSHRGKDFVEAMENARSLVKELKSVPKAIKFYFLLGGKSLGF